MTRDLSLTARRILFGKLLNAGQTCVAPDYVLAQRDVLPELIRLLQKELAEMLGEDPLSCPDYPCIVNAAHLRRLEGLLEGCEVLCGGQTGGGRMAPALVLPHSPAAPVMQEEIFGPILPLLPFDTLEEAVSFVQDRPRPSGPSISLPGAGPWSGRFWAGSPSAAAVSMTRWSTSPPLICPLAAWGPAVWAVTTAGPASRPSPTPKVS